MKVVQLGGTTNVVPPGGTPNGMTNVAPPGGRMNVASPPDGTMNVGGTLNGGMTFEAPAPEKKHSL